MSKGREPMPTSREAKARLGLSPTRSAPLSEDCKQVLQQLRGALTDAVVGLELDPTRPQDLARSLGLHRNLAWKVAKLVNGTDVLLTVPHVPGRNGMEIVARAMEKAGASARVVARIRAAMEAFDELVTLHAGDRGTLDLVVGGLFPGAAHRESMLQARRLAFRGNSAIWGLQARVVLVTNIIRPSAEDPRRVDVAQICGCIDFRGLRSNVVWPLFRRAAWGEGQAEHGVDGEPIVPVRSATDVPLLEEFCSRDLPTLEVVHSDVETTYWLPARTLGRTGELTCIYASVMRGIGSQYASALDTTCDLEASLATPVELLHFDLLAHESLTWAHEPRIDVYSRLEQRVAKATDRKASMRLPIDEELHELGVGLETMATPHMARYRELLDYVFAALGWQASEFRGFRTLLAYPPVPSAVTVSMDLLPEPAPGS